MNYPENEPLPENRPAISPDVGKFRKQSWSGRRPTIELEDLGLGDQPTRPQDEEAPRPDQPFHQYLISVGALGEKPGAEMGRILHDTGAAFAHAVGLQPILCVGYVSEAAQAADYLSAAKTWHMGLDKNQHAILRESFPRLYVALELLLGRSSNLEG